MFGFILVGLVPVGIFVLVSSLTYKAPIVSVSGIISSPSRIVIPLIFWKVKVGQVCTYVKRDPAHDLDP